MAMALADMIPTLTDAALASLRVNAQRLEAAGGRQQQQAIEALPLIEAELAVRLARKPPKKAAKPRAPRVTKAAKAAAEAAALQATEDAGDEPDASEDVAEITG
jgi:hypothetical protein